ncbi:hypothetical protein [Streptomyces erythrochromogenes]|uniref:hypothetical protein n=1 Tax=Streptomyces erythrochromogenes TaxID=285574 RepID=UPI0036A5E58A
MEFNWGDVTRALMLVEHPADTHLSQSSTPGGKSPLARNEDNTLNTHAVLFDGTKVALAILATGVALGAAGVKAAPHVKSGLISLRSKLRLRTEEPTTAEAVVPLEAIAEAEPEQPDRPRLRAV